jgi:hypothetical protein
MERGPALIGTERTSDTPPCRAANEAGPNQESARSHRMYARSGVPPERKKAIKRRAAGETLAEIAKSYAVDLSMISRLT